MIIVALLNPMQETPTICGFCSTTYSAGECPTCRPEREDLKRAIERRLRQDRGEKDRLIRDAEEWLG